MTTAEYAAWVATTESEAAFQARLIRHATELGWLVHHARPARTAKGWATPIQGHAGFPDLVLARGGRIIIAELKRAGAYPSAEQRKWLAALTGEHGVLVTVWRPTDWEQIQEELA